MPACLHELHTALWSSFLNLTNVRGFPPATAPMSVSTVLGLLGEVIDEEKKKDPDPDRVRVPRPLLGLAAWNLLVPENVDKPPYEKLVHHVTGLGAKEALAVYERVRNPLLFLARQYNILDYGWSTTPSDNKVRAELEICVQTPFPYLCDVVFPDRWSRCQFFWAPFQLPRRGAWSKVGEGKDVLEGTLLMPGGAKERRASVKVDVEYHRTSLGCENKYSIAGVPLGSCSGTFAARKELGKPGATRITHEREIDFGQVPSPEQQKALAYWVQAEVACLVLPA